MVQQTRVLTSEKRSYDEIEVTSRLLNIILEMPLEQQLDLLDKLDAIDYNGSRRHARHCLKNPWVVTIGPEKDNPYDYLARNISRCGMFIETRRPFSVGGKITMRFQVPASRKLYKIRGEIVRFQKNGVGIKFKRWQTEDQKMDPPTLLMD